VGPGPGAGGGVTDTDVRWRLTSRAVGCRGGGGERGRLVCRGFDVIADREGDQTEWGDFGYR
jgi:hypothetical protein